MSRGAISRVQVERENLKGAVAISALSGSENRAKALSLLNQRKRRKCGQSYRENLRFRSSC